MGKASTEPDRKRQYRRLRSDLQWHCDEQNDLFQSREADRPEPPPVYMQVMIELRAG